MTEKISPSTQPGDMPYFESEENARDAYQSWLDSNANDDDGSGDSGNWGKWRRIKRVGNWYLYVRKHQTKDKKHWALGGHDRDTGKDIWLWPQGKVKNQRYAFKTRKAVVQALRAYQQRIQNGEDPPRPEGPPDNRPSPKPGPGGPGPGGAGGLLGSLLSNPVVLGGAAVGGYLLYKQSATGAAAGGKPPKPPQGGS